MADKRRGGAGRSGGRRDLSVRVKSARGRKIASTNWLKRQLNDPYVVEARRLGYKSRAAFKLTEIDDKLKLLAKGARVVDLGAAPGGWTQVAVERTQGKGKIVALDINEMDPVAGATVLHCDFLADNAPALLKDALGGPADVVLSDMAAPATGHTQTDHLRIVGLVEVALDFAADVLAPGGAFVAKVFQGGTEGELLKSIKRMFKTVRHIKPPASRKESAETYVIALGFRGRGEK